MILITGAKGYIGRNLRIPNSIGVDREIEITRLNTLQRGQIEGIIHLAAISRVRECEISPIQAITTNVVGAIAVLELAKRKEVWVIFTSSLEAEFPRNIYGLTKRLSEELCKYYSTRYNIKVIILRLGNVFGGDDDPTKVIPTIYSLAGQNKDIIIQKPKQILHPTHINEVTAKIGELVNDIRNLVDETYPYQTEKIFTAGIPMLEFAKDVVKNTNSKSKIIVKEDKNG